MSAIEEHRRPFDHKGGWCLHAASEHGVSFQSGFLDGVEVEKALQDFIRIVRPVLEMTPFAVGAIEIDLSYGWHRNSTNERGKKS
jgi:hypothetical protein